MHEIMLGNALITKTMSQNFKKSIEQYQVTFVERWKRLNSIERAMKTVEFPV